MNRSFWPKKPHDDFPLFKKGDPAKLAGGFENQDQRKKTKEKAKLARKLMVNRKYWESTLCFPGNSRTI